MVLRYKLAMLAMATVVSVPIQAKEYIVKLNQNLLVSANEPREIAGLGILDRHPGGSLVKVDIPDGSPSIQADYLARLFGNPAVEYVVPNVKFQAFGQPDDPKFGQQWALSKVKAAAAWDLQAGQKEVVVAVIDTGIDWKHEDLKDNIWMNPGEIPGNNVDDDGNGFVDDVRGWDFRDNDADPMDLTGTQNPGHGTHCAGIVAAAYNNGVGIAGMAPQISLLPVRFLGADGSGDLLAGAKAIDYATNLGVDVISASWGARVSRDQVMPILEAIERANSKNVAFVVAAANDGKNNDVTEVYPANATSANVISVAASTNADAKPSWSNFGPAKVHVAAPGENIYSTLPGKYGNLSGTSMATPLVAGLVGLLKSQALDANIEPSVLALRSILQSTGESVAIDTACMCRVDAYAALNHLQNQALTVVPAAATVAPQTTAKFAGFGGSAPYTFTSSNPSIASIDANGALTAGQSEGEVTLTMTDSSGATAKSKTIRVANQSSGGGGGEACPLEDPMMCELLCQIMPELPWCN